MAPEYGATIGFFPIDAETLQYYKTTGRTPAEVDLIERYMKTQGMFYNPRVQIDFSDTLEIDLGTVEPCLAAPAAARPHPASGVSGVCQRFDSAAEAAGIWPSEAELKACGVIDNGQKIAITHGAVVIAAITR